MKKLVKNRWWYRLAFLAMLPVLILMGATTLSASTEVPRKLADLKSYPVEEATTIYKGSHVMLNTAGYAVAGADTDGYRYVGIAYEKVDNSSGSDGDLWIRVYRQGVFKVTCDSITQLMVGRMMFVTGSGSVDETSTYRIAAGRLVEYESATSGWIDIGDRVDMKGLEDHLHLVTDNATKSVRINNKTFTNTSGDITGTRVAPRVGATTTGSIRGIECVPGGSGAFGFANIQGIISECYLNTSGDVSGVVRAFEGKVDSPSGYAGTITGPACILKMFNDLHGTVTNGVYGLDIDNHGGNKAWDGLIRLGAALGTHSMTTATDKTGNTKSGTIKVVDNSGNIYHIQLYANA